MKGPFEFYATRHARHAASNYRHRLIDADGPVSLIAAQGKGRPNAPISAEAMKNGLYNLQIRMLDGYQGQNGGVMILHDGKILGGDAFFYYVGSYTFADGKWKGELVNREHTPSRGQRPLFGGKDVGIGFTGTYTDDGAEADSTALAGKQSIRFKAVLRRLADS